MNIKEHNILKLNKVLTLPFYNELAENGKILANLKPKKGAINKFISKQKNLNKIQKDIEKMTEKFKLVFRDCIRIVNLANIKYELIKEILNEYFGSSSINFENDGSKNIVNNAEINVDDGQVENIIDEDNIPLGITLTNKDKIKVSEDKEITDESESNRDKHLNDDDDNIPLGVPLSIKDEIPEIEDD
uniref:Uncharacterized protein n=1 Tax=Meloidogyne enterolobii TaxID=390850 RepID=A0A6V7W684_MELEN|nr:unnamed protein product [Meloidogyne enterolobii]